MFATVLANKVAQGLGLQVSGASSATPRIASGKPEVVVVGSCNVDLISYVPRFPGAGETLHGHRFQQGFGGKGANQCVMAAKLGIKTAMVAKVGKDSLGNEYVDNFHNLNVDTTHVSRASDAATGVAPIFVNEKSGENLIVVVGGANNKLSVRDIEKAKDMILNSKILMCQNEIEMDTTIAALKIAKGSSSVRSIFNPAPAPADGILPAEAYSLPDVFCVNETEAELMTGIKCEEDSLAKILNWAGEASAKLIALGANMVLITMGANGSFLMGGEIEGYLHVPVAAVKAIDTTGAGDSFLGALAYFLARDQLTLEECVHRANLVASKSVQKEGTQSSYPTAVELPGIV
eukprot:m.338872 g.338872  ORF g.338872 m.338872 type:complete len:348 (+) comp18576_c0_seq1:121-1164(+)